MSFFHDREMQYLILTIFSKVGENEKKDREGLTLKVDDEKNLAAWPYKTSFLINIV